ncbi:hypothetical protein ACFWVF_13225 [Streptomyces sp. NPDC058659]|uniref:hypothetical protein n=1 Tax=unclassified Streptomyces TaxID=2593676 RepID=UPI00365BD47A
MPEDSAEFESAMTTWQGRQEAPWGRLRDAVAEANLLRHLDDPAGGRPLRALDLAGGDALRLAARGHHVTVVDYAPAMLAASAERAAAGGLSERIPIPAHGPPLPTDSPKADGLTRVRLI